MDENQDSEECYWHLGMCYEKIDNDTKAVDYYKKGLELCNDSEYVSDYHLNIGRSLLMLSRLSEALFHFDKASEFEGNRLFAMHNKAIVYMCQKNFEKALQLLNYVICEGLDNSRIRQHLDYCRNKV